MLKPRRFPRGGKAFFAAILILPNFVIFLGFWPRVGHLKVQLLNDKSRYWYETRPKCLS